MRRLIVNADDFGRSESINHAIIGAHERGILTTASLMVNETGCEQAVQMAKACPRLGVGLHLSFVCGRAAQTPLQAPGLVNKHGAFTSHVVAAAGRYFFRSSLQSQLRAEIHAQFARFRQTGLVLDHVNGHLHLHLHPVIFRLLMQDAEQLGIQRMRLTYDWLRLNLRLARGRYAYRFLHWIIFVVLGGRARPVLTQRHIRHTARVFGLLQDSHVDEQFVQRLLPHLPEGDSELYSHPSLDHFKHEFDALVNAHVRSLIERLGIQLIRYQDL